MEWGQGALYLSFLAEVCPDTRVIDVIDLKEVLPADGSELAALELDLEKKLGRNSTQDSSLPQISFSV